MASYSPSEISELVDVKESTLRKYSLLLEGSGYIFDRNEQNQRWYGDKDVIAFQKFITLKQIADMTLKSSADAVYLWSIGAENAEVASGTHNVKERYNNDMTQEIHEELVNLKELISMQHDQIKSLHEHLEHEKYYQEKRDQVLLDSIGQLRLDIQLQRERQKAMEEQIMLQAPEEGKPTLWNRLFKNE